MTTEYNKFERRKPKSDTEKADGIIKRIIREGVPLNAARLREGDKREEIHVLVGKRLEELGLIAKPLKAIEEFERLVPVAARFKGQYDRLPEMMKESLSWKTIEARLFANGGALLELATRLNERGVLFAILNEKALIADAGEPIIKERHQKSIGDAIRYKWIDTQIVKDEKGNKVPSGYRPLAEGKEEKIFEQQTGLQAKSTHEYRQEIRRRYSHDSSETYRTGEFRTEVTQIGYRRVLEI